MDLVSVFFIAVGLAMDAFAVSISNGVVIKRYSIMHSIKFGLYFGIAQFVMPIIGFYGGKTFSARLTQYGNFIAFVLLCLIGGKMLYEAIKDMRSGEGEKKDIANNAMSAKNMIVLAIATSIDALAVGVSFAITGAQIYSAAVVIGVVAFTFSAVGVAAGKKISGVFKEGSAVFGGIVLIAIGIKILLF